MTRIDLLSRFLLLWLITYHFFAHYLTNAAHTLSNLSKVFVSRNGSQYVTESGRLRHVPDLCTLHGIGLRDCVISNLSESKRYNMLIGSPMKEISCPQNIKISPKLSMSKSSSYVLSVNSLNMHENNAAVTYFRDKLTICTRHRSYSLELALTTDTLRCDHLDRYKSGNHSKISYLTYPQSGGFIYGEDPRILAHNEELFVTFNYCNHTKWSHRRIAYMKVKVRYEEFQVRSQVIFMTAQNAPYTDQKNWMPFFYHGKLFFVYSMFPHHILYPFHDTVDGQRRHGEEHAVVAESVAVTAMTNFTWPYGELRGGTPALLLGDVYLAFFHSSRRGAKTKRTYFMGAYTFSSAPPFQILSISQEPIVAKQFYQGKFSSPTFDYVVFPTSFLYDQYRVYLYVGKQDTETWMMVLNRSALLASLVPVHNLVVGNSKWGDFGDEVIYKNSFHYAI